MYENLELWLPVHHSTFCFALYRCRTAGIGFHIILQKNLAEAAGFCRFRRTLCINRVNTVTHCFRE